MYEFTEEQIENIRITIENMLDPGRGPFVELDRICDADYLKGREKYPISALVYTGFDMEQQNMPGFTIQKNQYGRGRFMPELYNREAVIQLYSNTADPCGSNEVKGKIGAFGEQFQIIEFTVTDTTYDLDKLIQVSFNGFTDKGIAKIAKRRTIYQRER